MALMAINGRCPSVCLPFPCLALPPAVLSAYKAERSKPYILKAHTNLPPALSSCIAQRSRRLSQSRVPVDRRSIRQPGALPEQASPTASSARASQHHRISPTPEHRWPRECPMCRRLSTSGIEPEATAKYGHSNSSPSLVSTHLHSPRSPLSI
jgi:hypothetical protein